MSFKLIIAPKNKVSNNTVGTTKEKIPPFPREFLFLNLK